MNDLLFAKVASASRATVVMAGSALRCVQELKTDNRLWEK